MWYLCNRISKEMHNIYLHDLNINTNLKRGSVILTGRTGRKYKNAALHVPGYGWIPCSQKWSEETTTDPERLVMVVSDAFDEYKPITSDIWITTTLVKKIADVDLW